MFVLSYQPMIGNADFRQGLYLARGADLLLEPAADETAAVRPVPLGEAAAMIRSREIIGAGTIIGVQCALMLRQALSHLCIERPHRGSVCPRAKGGLIVLM